MTNSNRMDDPTCAVLLPVFNGRDFIRTAIDSALVQGDAVSEIIVVDNCSTDGTWEYLQQHRHERMSIYRNESNVGLFGNFNRCLEYATSDILVFLCVDDALCEHGVENALSIFSQKPNLALLNMAGEAINEHGRVFKRLGAYMQPGVYSSAKARVPMLSFLARTGLNPFNYPTGVFINRRLLPELRFDTSFKKCGDIDYYFRAMAYGDLVVSNQLACRILFHSQQEGQQERNSTVELDEFVKIVVQSVPPLSIGEARSIELQFRGLALWRGLRGNLKGLVAHWRFAFAKGSQFMVVAKFLEFLIKRITLKCKVAMVDIKPENQIALGVEKGLT